MKNIISKLSHSFWVILLIGCFQNIQGQKIQVKKIEKKFTNTNSYVSYNFYGKWIVKKVDGEIYEKSGDKNIKIENGFRNWRTYEFTFKSDSLSIRFRNKLIRKNPYEMTDNGTVFKIKRDIGLVYTLPVTVIGNKMTIIYSPEAYYKNLADRLTSVDDLKKRYFIPQNVVFHLER